MPVGPERSATARLILSAAVTTLVVAAGTVAAGWPYWQHHRLGAVPNAGVAAVLAVAGVLLGAQRSSRRCGLLLTAAGGFSALTWLISWDAAALPLVGSVSQSAFWLTYGWGLLIYPGNALRGRWDRWWVGSSAVVLLLGQAATIAVSRPEWNGFAPDVFWPAPLLLDHADFVVFMKVLTVLYVAVPASFVLLALVRVRTYPGLDRIIAGPVLLLAGFTALVAAVTYPDLMSGPTLGQLEDAIALQGASSIAAPCALLAVCARARLLVTTTADRLHAAIGSPTPSSVRDALRTVLRDGTLDVHYPQAERDSFVDLHGRPVDLPPVASGGTVADRRWYLPARSADGTFLAVLSLNPVLRHHRPQVDAVLDAAAVPLEHAGAQSGLRAQLVRLGDARRRASRTWFREWEMLERDLGDRARGLADLADLAARADSPAHSDDAAYAGAAGQAGPGQATARALAEIAEGLRAARGELAAITDALRPAILDEEGLGGALAALTATLDRPSQLRVPPERFDPASERALYLALAATLRGLPASDGAAVRVEVRTDGTSIVGEVTTLAPVPTDRARVGADHVRALGGSFAVRQNAGGTTARVTVPCG
ncbi:hypothetical protein CC117_21045 [Parafrankia colletiae]|uniref:Uncharacterized protein n=1 Tax=Parafrankia colletiae TaxID=573497 RepID=A0A1S1QMN0_9ACTN|nr:hypothetical protein [Parafrankia colletiae]MCK9900579.1 hypothetical protein [Frankia sp. Cpl3]OHV34691.1 hypothetical protein CC117_21045 [Parafrankia colletiae]